MKTIPLTQGKVAIVDDEDYRRLSKHKWYVAHYKHTFYAVRKSSRKSNGKQKIIFMHRDIMNTPKGLQIDHHNHCGLDNRKTNLRNCTCGQNQHNRQRQESGSQYKGISWHKRAKKWQAQIRHNYQRIYLGLFSNEIEAARAYDRKAKELFGEFAVLNEV